MSGIPIPQKLREQGGAILVMVAILFALVFIGLLALAIDVGHLMVVRNELQNAADAGALAGTLRLYDANGDVNPNANQAAHKVGVFNKSDNKAVEIVIPDDNANGGDVLRGHWNPVARTFTRNDSLDRVPLIGVDIEDLNVMEPFINAVQVTAWRGNPDSSDLTYSPATSFFARIFGINSFSKSAQATAWLGYASHIVADKADLPLALCEESLITDHALDCDTGRRLDSGGALDLTNAGGWTDFTQANGECPGEASPETVETFPVCEGSINPQTITFGWPMAAKGGEVFPVYTDILDCWQDHYENVGKVWEVVLPVVDCDGPDAETCPTVTHVVKVNIVFVSPETTVSPSDTPTTMDDRDWTTIAECAPYRGQTQLSPPVATAIAALKNQDTIYRDISDADAAAEGRWPGESEYTEDIARWDCFTDYFELKDADGDYAPLAPRSIYFKPDCTQPTDMVDGVRDDENFGFLSRRPVLVE